MAMTTGNVSNLRLPCAAIAQAVAEVPEGTRKGAVIGAIGIAVSVFFGLIGVFLGAVGGGAIIGSFPTWLTNAFKLFLLPAVWGAVFGQFALRGPYYVIPALLFAGIPLFLAWPGYVVIPIAVFGTLITGYLMYKYLKIAPKAG